MSFAHICCAVCVAVGVSVGVSVGVAVGEGVGVDAPCALMVGVESRAVSAIASPTHAAKIPRAAQSGLVQFLINRFII